MSKNEILEGYQKLENTDELFDSDILILPKMMDKGILYNQLTQIKNEYTDVQVKIYCSSQNPKVYLSASAPETLQLGACIVSTIAGMIKIYEFVKGHFEEKNIKLKIFRKIKNSEFLYVSYEGKASDFEKKISKILTESEIDLYQPITNQSGSDDPDMNKKYK